MRSSPLVRCTLLFLALLITFGASSAGASAAYADDGVGSKKVVDWGPPKDKPKEWRGLAIGVTSDGNYCIIGEYDGCDLEGEGGELPGTIGICEGADGMASAACSKKEQRKFEEKELAKWQKKATKDATYDKLSAYLEKCVKKDHKPFKLCLHEAPDHVDASLMTWVGGKISEMVSNGLKEAARFIGESVVWLLEMFADAFNSWSTVKLADTGISRMLGISLTLSVVVATFLLIVQFGKVAISQDGGPFATAATGLAKWAAILAVYVTATQVALNWSDEVSTWIINYSFDGGGSGEADAQKAMQKQLGTLFVSLSVGGGGAAVGGGILITGSSVLANAVGVIIVVGILCILAIAALWVEMMMRQVAIMILIVSMPIVLAGQMADSTREWWPKARNALIATILTKPAIVLCFGIGFKAMSDASGIRNVLVGFMTFVVAGFSWPVIARFMTFTSNGEGNSAASGLISSVGSSVSSMFGGYQASPSGAGVVGGGPGYTAALEDDNASVATSGSNSSEAGGFWGKAGTFAKTVGGPLGMGLQFAAMAKDTLESAGQNAAAHAGLGPAASGGRHVVIPPHRSSRPQENEPENSEQEGSDEASSPAPAPSPVTESAPPTAPASAPTPAEPSSIDAGAANWNGPRPTEPDSEGS